MFRRDSECSGLPPEEGSTGFARLHNGMVFGGIGFVFLAVVMFAPEVDAGGDEKRSEADEGVERAGDAARFRVIDRFPDSEKSGDEEARPQPTIEKRVSKEVERAMRRRAWNEAAGHLEKRIGEFDAPLRFLRGYLYVRRDEFREALGVFESLGQDLPLLADYSAYFAGVSAREIGEHHRAVVQAARVPESSRLHGDALHLLVKSLLKAGTSSDVSRAGKVAERYLEKYPDGEHAASMRLELAGTHRRAGDWEAFAERLFGLLENQPLSEEADRAERLLEKHASNLPSEWREKVEDRPKKYRIARYRALFDKHRSETLIEELGGEIEDWTPGDREHCRALYWVGKSHTKLRKHETAGEWYDEILEECAGVSPFEKKALYLGAKSAWNSGDEPEALRLYERLWEEFEGDSLADDAFYFAARIHREQNRPRRARELLDRQVGRYPDGDMADDAHWLRVKEWYENDEHRRIVDYVDGLETPVSEERGSRGRLEYFKGRALEALEAPERAASTYLNVANTHPLGYYALLAVNRAARLDERALGDDLCGDDAADVCEELEVDAEPTGRVDLDVPRRVRRAPEFQKGALLLGLGILEEAEAEFDRLLDRFAGEEEANLGIADLLDRAGAYHLSHSLPERAEGWDESYPGTDNRRLWTMAYPRAFRSTVRKWSRKKGVSEALIYAIIRKESAFRAEAESWANARGLMQLMWGTAREVARDEGLARLSKNDLLEANTNIRLGTAYLGGLSERLSGHPALVVAGYNGGYGNVSGWLANREGMPLDLWVEEIPYGQTRKYAKIALAYYWAYEWLYDDRAVPRIEFEVSGSSGD